VVHRSIVGVEAGRLGLSAGYDGRMTLGCDVFGRQNAAESSGQSAVLTEVWEGFVDIFTDAPTRTDMEETEEIGQLGPLRIVRVDDKDRAWRQLQQYRESGFFGTRSKSKAVAFVTTGATIERPSLPEIDLDQTLRLE
jgi:hypothetical protein